MGRRKLNEAPSVGDKKKLIKAFNKKKSFIFKKTYELSTLCGIPAGVIIYGPNGDEPPSVWPEEPQKFNSVLARYMNTSSEERKKRALNLTSMPEKLKHDDQVLDAGNGKQLFEKLGNNTGFSWDDRISSLSSEQLMGLVNHLNSILENVNSRIDVMKRVKLESEQQLLYHAAAAEEQKIYNMQSLQQYQFQNQDYLRWVMNQGRFYNHNNMANGFPICDPTPLACYAPASQLQPQPHQSYIP